MEQPDYTKLDGSLVSALARELDASERLTVLLQIDEALPDAAREKLAEFDVRIPRRPTRTLTAHVTRSQISWLSHQAWIRTIQLSTPLRPRND